MTHGFAQAGACLLYTSSRGLFQKTTDPGTAYCSDCRCFGAHSGSKRNYGNAGSRTHLYDLSLIHIYDRIVDRNLLIRRINITANRLVDESSVKKEEVYEQLDLFTDYEAQRKKQEEEEVALDREKRMQEAMLSIKKKFGKNAVLKGMNLQEGATARDRNEQIGGHKA